MRFRSTKFLMRFGDNCLMDPHLLWLPFPAKAEREVKYAVSFLFLLVSSYLVFGLLSPFDCEPSFQRFGLFPEIEAVGTAGHCDYSKGRWVWDETYADRYYNESCPFLDAGFRCRENGRTDDDYLKWLWQPDGCDLPRFNASKLLERNRNGRIVFAGDSLGRNQWESMVCMLSQAISNKSTIYEDNGNPVSRHKGYLSIRFQEYNLTVEYYRVPFLVVTGRPPRNSSANVRTAVHVDELHWFSRKWVSADVIVFNDGHWWNQDKTSKMGFYFQEKGVVNMSMDVMEAYRRSLQTWKLWALENLDLRRRHVFFRSYSPVHYRHGAWNEGGECSISKEPEFDPNTSASEPNYNLHISETLREMEDGIRKVHFLNITHLTEFRNDGHPSNHREPDTPPNAPQDCSHWCLPGVPDTWNEILYAQLMSR